PMGRHAFAAVIVQPLGSGWLGRRDAARTLATGLAIMGVGFALTAFVTSPTMLAATVAVWTAGEIVTAGIAGTILTALAPAHLRGRYAGLFGFAWSAAEIGR